MGIAEMWNDLWVYLGELNTVSMLFRLLFAAIAGGVIGIERGYHGRAAGLRTHMLVCMGAALTAIIGSYLSIQMHALGVNSDAQRTAAQVMSGVGFLGAGTILFKRGNQSKVTGLTTAAGLWATAAVGLAVGFGLYFPAFCTVLLVIIVFTLMAHLEFRMNRNRHRILVYLEIQDVNAVKPIVALLSGKFGADEIQITPPRSGSAPHVGVEALIRIPPKTTEESKLLKLQALEHVIYAIRIP